MYARDNRALWDGKLKKNTSRRMKAQSDDKSSSAMGNANIMQTVPSVSSSCSMYTFVQSKAAAAKPRKSSG